MRLNLLWINILPVAEYDHFLLAARNEQVYLRIEMAEIAREQPAIFQHGSRRVLTVPVALHHDRAANRYLAHGWTFLLRLWFNDLLRPREAVVLPSRSHCSTACWRTPRQSSRSGHRPAARQSRAHKNHARSGDRNASRQ